jgi:hypothetical protein
MKVRKALGAAVVGVAALALTGCIDTEANFDVNEDGTVNGTMTVEMATELGQMFGITDKEAFEQQLLDPESGSIPEGQDVIVTEEDGKYKMKITYDNTPLDDEDMKIEVISDDQLKFTYKSEGMAAGETGVSADDMEGMEGSIKFTLEFPGDITETVPSDLPGSVTVDGNVVRIDSDLTETLDLQFFSNRGGATSGGDGGADLGSSNDDDEGGSNGFGIGIGIAVAVIALVGVAYMVVRRRSGDSSELPPPNAPDSSN